MSESDHKANILLSQAQHQVDITTARIYGEAVTTLVAAPFGGMTPVNGAQLATRAANAAHHRRIISSALANGLNPPISSINALRELGFGGV
jgi:hypothetical protein